MAKYVIGEGKEFAIGDKVYYRIPASKTVIRPDGKLRFPDGYAEVTCRIVAINENAHDDSRYTLEVSQRTLSYVKGNKITTSGNHFSRKRTIGNGRKRARRVEMTSEDRKLAIQALVSVGGRDNIRAAMELLK